VKSANERQSGGLYESTRTHRESKAFVPLGQVAHKEGSTSEHPEITVQNVLIDRRTSNLCLTPLQPLLHLADLVCGVLDPAALCRGASHEDSH
jgi:hypothetical protein